MMEYFVVYDTTTGAIRWQGSGPVGTAGAQELPDGAASLALPFDAFKVLPELDALKMAVVALSAVMAFGVVWTRG